MGISIVDIFKDFKSQPDGNYDSVVTEYANLDIEWVVKNGNQVISANTSWGNATADARNLLVLVNGNLTVDAGKTLTAAARKRGMFIYVNGNLDLNGIISMTARGASAIGQKLLLFDDYIINAVGGDGAPSVTVDGNVTARKTGENGADGDTNKACGGGASGGGRADTTYKSKAYTGAGAAGTSYSGGSGGGGASRAATGTSTASAASPNGGAGSNGVSNRHSGGGAGNPGGSGTGNGTKGTDGTGGLLVVFIKKKLIVTTGLFESKGLNGGYGGSDFPCGGGASGGGIVNIFYGSLEGTIAYDVDGGLGGGSTEASQGGNGGKGYFMSDKMVLAGGSNFFMFF